MSGINVTCCVRKCPTKLPQNRKNFQVFSLPADRPTKRKWLNALKKASVPVHSGVCRRHFTGNYLNLITVLLSSGAVLVSYQVVGYGSD